MKRSVVLLSCSLLIMVFAISALADSGTVIHPSTNYGEGAMPYGLGGNSYTEKVGGGTWDHGTSFILPAGKQAYSNYHHETLYHRSSCRVGENYGYSGYVTRGDTSYSQASGLANETSQAWWSTNPL